MRRSLFIPVLLLAAGCTVAGDPDEPLPTWYPAFVVRDRPTTDVRAVGDRTVTGAGAVPSIAGPTDPRFWSAGDPPPPDPALNTPAPAPAGGPPGPASVYPTRGQATAGSGSPTVYPTRGVYPPARGRPPTLYPKGPQRNAR